MLALVLGLAVISATPADIGPRLSSARAGDTVTFAPGNYGEVAIRDRAFDPPLTLQAGKARFRLVIDKSSGIRVVGGELGPALGDNPNDTGRLGKLGYAANVIQSQDIGFSGTAFTDAVRGLVIDRSSHITVDRATLTRLITDGINIALSHHVTVTNSTCSDFTPRPADHPDCIQMWSRPTAPPTSDIVLRGNVARGTMQGFTGFNHVRNGVNDGGYDRIVIEDNEVYGTYPQGVSIANARDSVIRRNKTRAIAGARGRVSVNTPLCERCQVEDNDIGPKPR
jgi:hypothetical protein